MESLGGDVAHDHLLQSRLIDGYLPLTQTLDFCVVDIHTSHIDSHLGKAGTRH